MFADIFGIFFLIFGTVFCLIGIYGVIRLDSIYNRLHATAVVLSFGSLGIMTAVLISGPPRAGLKALATAVFILITGPLVTHILAKTAYSIGIRTPEHAKDDLAERRR